MSAIDVKINEAESKRDQLEKLFSDITKINDPQAVNMEINELNYLIRCYKEMKQKGETDESKIFNERNIIGGTVYGICGSDEANSFDKMSVDYIEINSACENRGFKISAEGNKVIITELR